MPSPPGRRPEHHEGRQETHGQQETHDQQEAHDRRERMTESAAPWLTGQLAELVARLRAAGWDPSSEEVAEAVWLARWTGPPAQGGSDADSTGPRYPWRQQPSVGAYMAQTADSPDPGPGADPPQRAGTPAPVSLYAPRRHGGAPRHSFPVRAPAAGSLSGLLELQRALRPLHGYRPALPPATGALDEEATADLSARSAAVRPVFGTAGRRATEIQLLMDASPTASVWHPTLERLRQTFEQLGAFRDVQVRYLHRARDGAPLIGTGPDPDGARLRPADQYRDTTGRRLTLVVSDCVGPLWQDGRAQRLLHHWTGRSPLAVVQPLPPRLWPRTALPAEPGMLVRDRGADGAVTFASDGFGPPPGAGALPVPVLLPIPEALGNWARLLGGSGERAVRGAAAWVLPRHHAMPPPAVVPGTVPPRALLREFRSTASTGALDLAEHLAVVPLLLPVIHLVQEAMLPDTGPMELAEVLLSGLLERLPDREGAPGPRYDFAPGVRELLLQSVDRTAAALIMKHLSGYITHRFGKGTRNFPAVAVARLTGRGAATAEHDDEADDGTGAPDEDELFAEVPAEVVRFYLPERAAAGRTEEAERLLARWRAEGDPQLLHRARSLAEEALATDGDGDGERVRLVLAQVLHALAGTATVRRSPGDARALLTEAERLLTAREPGVLLELAAVQHDLWQGGSGTAALLRAERTLRLVRELSGSGQLPADRTAVAAGLRLGRVLLALAGAAPAHRERAAPEAVTELRAAAEALTTRRAPDGSPPEDAPDAGRPDDTAVQLCAALLDLASALRLTGATAEERLSVLERAETAAGERRALRLRCIRDRAELHRENRSWEAATAAYAEAERLTARDSTQRGELLIEWGEMLLTDANDLDRAEGILREALTRAPAEGPVTARAALLLGRVLLLRFEREGFKPDLYEGSHLLEQAARQDPDPGRRAEAWLLTGGARALFPESAPQFQQAAAEFTTALEEARRAEEQAGDPGSVTAARALHARGVFHEGQGRTDEALADYRAAGDEWRGLASRLADVPWDEVRETRARIAALAAV